MNVMNLSIEQLNNLKSLKQAPGFLTLNTLMSKEISDCMEALFNSNEKDAQEFLLLKVRLRSLAEAYSNIIRIVESVEDELTNRTKK